MRRVYKPCMQRRGSDIALFFALACAITWTSAAPAARAWMAHENPSPGAIALAGVSAFGPLLAALLVGWRRKSLMWGVWHLAYAITPTSAGFDWVTFAMNMLFTLAYAPVIALFMERSGRSIAVALAIHAGAHFDHLEAAPLALVGLHGFNIVFAAVASTWALFALRAGDKRRHDQNAPSLR